MKNYIVLQAVQEIFSPCPELKGFSSSCFKTQRQRKIHAAVTQLISLATFVIHQQSSRQKGKFPTLEAVPADQACSNISHLCSQTNDYSCKHKHPCLFRGSSSVSYIKKKQKPSTVFAVHRADTPTAYEHGIYSMEFFLL